MVLRALGVGDLLAGVPALRALARAFPDHRRVLAAPGPLEPLALMTGAVHEVSHAGPLQPLDRALAAPEVAVNLHGRGPESHRVLGALRPRRLVAFRNDRVSGTENLPAWRPDEHEVLRWCRLLEEEGISTDPEDLRLSPPPVPPPAEAVGATLIHPGAASPARRWLPERWAAVARAERAGGRRVLLTGGPEEGSLCRRIAALAALPAGSSLAGRTGLEELAAAVAAAGRVACGDTGVAHLATAFGTPSVVLFGPVPPAHWGPPADRPEHVAIWKGSVGDPHGRGVDPGLLRIRVEEVVAALERLPERDVAPGAFVPRTPGVSSVRSRAGRAGGSG